MSKIFISIASYRDPDLINTVKNCYNNASNKEELFFSILSQAEDNEHPDLSFIPNNQIKYLKVHWSESLGACWARTITSKDSFGDFFLQIDSHSRFKFDWDNIIVNSFNKVSKYWSRDIIITNYPDPFEIDKEGNEKLVDYSDLRKLDAYWDEESKMIQAFYDWPNTVNTKVGDEVFFLSGNSFFCTIDVIKRIPYDSELYFTGEEPSMALRAYTRGIKLISPVVKYMYTNYKRDFPPRNLHWQDHSVWWQLNQKSYQRLAKIMTGDMSLGIFGIGSKDLFKKYQDKSGIYLEDKKEIIGSV
jgi:hypothetical protein